MQALQVVLMILSCLHHQNLLSPTRASANTSHKAVNTSIDPPRTDDTTTTQPFTSLSPPFPVKGATLGVGEDGAVALLLVG